MDERTTITYNLTTTPNISMSSYNMLYTFPVPEYVIQQTRDAYLRELRIQPQIAAPRENKSAEFFTKRQKEIDAFMDIVGCYIHGALYEAASYALAKLRRQEVDPSSGAAEDLCNLLSALRQLNFTDDAPVAQTTQKLCEALRASPYPDREWSEIEEQLRQISQETRTTLLQLSYEQREEREAW